jgi:hypothetical protein
LNSQLYSGKKQEKSKRKARETERPAAKMKGFLGQKKSSIRGGFFSKNKILA